MSNGCHVLVTVCVSSLIITIEYVTPTRILLQSELGMTLTVTFCSTDRIRTRRSPTYRPPHKASSFQRNHYYTFNTPLSPPYSSIPPTTSFQLIKATQQFFWRTLSKNSMSKMQTMFPTPSFPGMNYNVHPAHLHRPHTHSLVERVAQP